MPTTQRLGKRNWKYISISISFLLMLMIGFQNCQDQRHIINIASRHGPAINTVELILLPEEGSSAIKILADDFAVDTSVTFVVKDFSDQAELENYTSFEWSVFLHEDLGNVETTLLNQDDNEKITTQPNYEWSFNARGVYNVLATLTSSEETSLDISGSIIIGQCPSPPLDIIYENILSTIDQQQPEDTSSSTSTSLTLNELSFSVERSDQETMNINNGLWEIRHNGHKVESSLFNVDQYTLLTLVGLNIAEEDTITFEFFTQLEGESCITYSEKSYKMTNGSLLPSDSSSTTTTMTTSSSTSTTTTTI